MARTACIKKYTEFAVELSEDHITNIQNELTKLVERIDKHRVNEKKYLVDVYETEFHGHACCLINIGWKVEVYESS